MTTEANSSNQNLDEKVIAKEIEQIKQGLKEKTSKLVELLQNRVGNKEWTLWKMDYQTKNEGNIDLIFHAPDNKKGHYVLVDISIPHLQVGQKYELPAKAKAFQKEEKVALTRIKKAIILVRKGTDTISTRPSRIRCPILEVQLEKLISKPRKNNPKPKYQQERNKPRNQISSELLYALKEAIVHECLSTMHKRKNKYIRKGLWRWIEREIMDPNVHFYLIILSSIYQGKTGEVLSRKFKTAEEFSGNPEGVISALFTRETNLADEIRKNSERHKKALKKFLACFSQTPPFEYLKSIFLKEFRSTGDGLKARFAVFTTLTQLLERCGFEGEKETQYPLEILDELGIFQGIMAGNYQNLRIINASKKLKHLVPEVTWEKEDIFQLRNQLAKALNLPALEFNLNAFLPQAFVHDAKYLAKTRKDAVKADDKKDRQKAPQKSEPSKVISEEVNDLAETTARPQTVEEPEIQDKSIPEQEEQVTQIQDERDRRHKDKKKRDCDESKHRHFESFGGQLEEDMDSLRLAIARDKYEAERVNRLKKKKEAAEKEWEIIEEVIPPTKSARGPVLHKMPLKKKSPQKPSDNGNKPSNKKNNNPNRRRNNNNRNSNSNNRNNNRNNNNRSNYRRPKKPNTNSR